MFVINSWTYMYINCERLMPITDVGLVEIQRRLHSNDGRVGCNPFRQFVDDVSALWDAR